MIKDIMAFVGELQGSAGIECHEITKGERLGVEWPPMTTHADVYDSSGWDFETIEKKVYERSYKPTISGNILKLYPPEFMATVEMWRKRVNGGRSRSILTNYRAPVAPSVGGETRIAICYVEFYSTKEPEAVSAEDKDSWSVEECALMLSDKYGVRCIESLSASPVISWPEGSVHANVHSLGDTKEALAIVWLLLLRLLLHWTSGLKLWRAETLTRSA